MTSHLKLGWTALRHHGLPLIILGLFAAWSLRAIFQPGLMQTHDGLWQVQRASEMFQMLKLGQFPVRWAHNLDNGYGIPLFNFVYPLPYYLTAPLMAAGVVNITAIKIITFLAYSLGGLGLYFLFAKHRVAALTAALLYLLNPYQFVNIFVRGALGESLVIGLAPWLFLIINRLVHDRVRFYDPLIFALVVLAHNFLGLILLAIVAAYGLVQISWRKLGWLYLLTLGLAAFFWLPMLAEKNYLLSGSESNFSYIWSDHFIYPWQLLYSRWDYWYSMPGYLEDGLTFQLGFAPILVLGLTPLYLALSWSKLTAAARLSGLFLWLTTLALILAATINGRFIWELFPILQTMQFPWRLLGLIVVLVGILTGQLLSARLAKHRLSGLALCLFLLALALFNTRNYHRPIKTLSRDEFTVYNDVFIGKTTTSSRSEIMPKWSTVERYQPQSLRLFNPRFGIDQGEAAINSAEDQPGSLRFTATAENERAQAIYYHNYYPSWQITKDGKPWTVRPSAEGNMLIPLEQGVHEYHLYLGKTPLAQLADGISVLSLLSLGLVWWKGRRCAG